MAPNTPPKGRKTPPGKAKTTSSSNGVAATSSRPQKSKNQKPARELPLWRRILRGTLLGFFLLFALGLASFLIAYMTITVPEPNALAASQTSIVYYNDGKTEIGRFANVNRVSVNINQIPKSLQQAVISAEDRTFYTNRGVSPRGIARSLFNNLLGRSTQGGSTITQQYVKNYFLTSDQSYTRKIKEGIISLKIDREYTKDKILQDYLNTAYFGRGAFGVQAASQTYFKKDVEKLSTNESVFLAALLNSPETLDPTRGPEAARAVNIRMGYALDGMVKLGYLTEDERAKMTMPKVFPRSKPKYTDPAMGYIMQSVRRELHEKVNLEEKDIEKGGLRIVTTIDKGLQEKATTAVQDSLPRGPLSSQLHVGLVATTPGDGAVVAMYGGAKYDAATNAVSDADQAMMQGGSTFKLFAMTAAIENGKSLRDRYSGKNPYVAGKTNIYNAFRRNYGDLTMIDMTVNSVNTSYVRLNAEIGPERTREAAISAGIPEGTPGIKDDNLTNVLGTASVTVWDMAAAYNTVNSGGIAHRNYLIKTAQSNTTGLNYQANTTGKRAYSQEISQDLGYALGQVVTRGSGHWARTIGRPAAGKTGTTDNSVSAWFVGYTPDSLTTAVGMYYSKDNGRTMLPMENIPGLGTVFGEDKPMEIWSRFMRAASIGKPAHALPPPAWVNTTRPAHTPATTTTSSTSSEKTTTSSTPPPQPTTVVPTTTTSSSSTSSTSTSSSSSSSSKPQNTKK